MGLFHAVSVFMFFSFTVLKNGGHSEQKVRSEDGFARGELLKRRRSWFLFVHVIISINLYMLTNHRSYGRYTQYLCSSCSFSYGFFFLKGTCLIWLSSTLKGPHWGGWDIRWGYLPDGQAGRSPQGAAHGEGIICPIWVGSALALDSSVCHKGLAHLCNKA